MNRNPSTPHPLAGRALVLTNGLTDSSGSYPAGTIIQIEDTFIGISGHSVAEVATRNPAAANYTARTAGLGMDCQPVNELYGKIGPFGYIVHVSELSEILNTNDED